VHLRLAAVLCLGAILVVPSAGMSAQLRHGGVARLALLGADLDSLDPALAYAAASWYLLEPTCATLIDGDGRPEVAAAGPRISRDRRTYTFRLRNSFRFSDGTPVAASAFEHAIERTLARGVDSPWAAYTRQISSVEARGNILVVRLARPVPDFPAQTSFLCAVPPSLPADPEGIADFPAAGPYYIAEYRRGDRVVIRRNRFYGGTQPHHVERFDVDLRVSSWGEVLDRVERGQADWGWALAPTYFDPARRLAAKYGVNKSRFFVHPGDIFRGYAFNTSRPLFRDNPRLRQAVNFAIDRSAFRRASGGELSSRLTDQYLPPGMRGFVDAPIYPLRRPNLRRARELARGHTRGGKVVLFTIDLPNHRSFAQSIRQNLQQIGLDVEIKAFPREAYFGRLMARGAYDLGFATWVPDYSDPYAVLNIQLDGRFIGATNWSRFDSPGYNRLLRRAAGLQGAARYRAYGRVDVRLARHAAPMVAVDYLTEPVLVSGRVGCVRKPFDLAAICLR
jgi:peptide/nickel transport system substrate-binding protein